MTPTHHYFVRQPAPANSMGDLGVWSWVQETFGSKPDSPASERGIRPQGTSVTTACTLSFVDLQKGLLNSGLSVGSSLRSGGREQPDGAMGPTTRRSLAAFAARVAPGVDLSPVVGSSSIRLFNSGVCAALRSSAAGFPDPARPATSPRRRSPGGESSEISPATPGVPASGAPALLRVGGVSLPAWVPWGLVIAAAGFGAYHFAKARRASGKAPAK